MNMDNKLKEAFKQGFEKEAASQYKAFKKILDEGSSLFHGTTRENTEKILEKGLKPTRNQTLPTVTESVERLKPGGEYGLILPRQHFLGNKAVSLTPDKSFAKRIAQKRAKSRSNIISNMTGVGGAKPAVLRIDPTEDMLQNLRIRGGAGGQNKTLQNLGNANNTFDLSQHREVLHTGPIEPSNINIDEIL